MHALLLSCILSCILLLLLLLKHIWDPLITRWFFTLQLKSKNENAKSIIYYLHKKTIIKNITTKSEG